MPFQQHLDVADEVGDSDFSEISGDCSTSMDSDIGHTDRGYEADTEYTDEDDNDGKLKLNLKRKIY